MTRPWRRRRAKCRISRLLVRFRSRAKRSASTAISRVERLLQPGAASCVLRGLLVVGIEQNVDADEFHRWKEPSSYSRAPMLSNDMSAPMGRDSTLKGLSCFTAAVWVRAIRSLSFTTVLKGRPVRLASAFKRAATSSSSVNDESVHRRHANLCANVLIAR
jgi:hypothetical protein